MIQILNRRSSTHPNHCEDSYWVEETDNHIVGAVLDGCSTGIDSYFASTTIRYCLQKAFVHSTNQSQLSTSTNYDDYTDQMIGDVAIDLRSVQKQLNLDVLNFLSTIIFFVYDKENKTLYVKFFGDGSVSACGLEYTHDENNMPDYLAYHLNDSWSGFFKWVRNRKTLIFEEVETFAVCSDGIDSFVNVKNPHLDRSIAKDFLLHSEQFSTLKTGLVKRFNILTNRNEVFKSSDELFCWDIQDDLTVIRYANI